MDYHRAAPKVILNTFKTEIDKLDTNIKVKFFF